MSGRTSTIAPTNTIKLRPDLTAPSDAVSGLWYDEVIFDAQGSLTEVLALTGKHAIYGLRLRALTPETITVKLTIDGEVIWNDTFTATAIIQLYGNPDSTTDPVALAPFTCESSLSLEIETATDTVATLHFAVRAIK